MAMTRATKDVHKNAAGSGRVQPASSAASRAGADSVRRRLSNIFQKPIAVR
ncbi:hypothetical protein D3C83_310870 [compost metagenome]